jgi:hypothetical protein
METKIAMLGDPTENKGLLFRKVAYSKYNILTRFG